MLKVYRTASELRAIAEEVHAEVTKELIRRVDEVIEKAASQGEVTVSFKFNKSETEISRNVLLKHIRDRGIRTSFCCNALEEHFHWG